MPLKHVVILSKKFMKVLPCKICTAEATYAFSREMTRPRFARTMDFFRCGSCGYIFSDALDSLNDEGWKDFYAYPEYLEYDPGAVSQRRKERTKALIKHVEKKFGMKNPKILHHGNGNCLSAVELLQEGYDVWTTFDHLENWDRSLGMQEALARADFDIVCSIEVAEHFARPIEEFAQAMGCLKKGGVFCGTTCMNNGIPIKNMIEDTWHYTKPHTLNAGHVSLYSLESLDVLAAKIASENHTEHGDQKLREVSHMPSTSVFFQFKKI